MEGLLNVLEPKSLKTFLLPPSYLNLELSEAPFILNFQLGSSNMTSIETYSFDKIVSVLIVNAKLYSLKTFFETFAFMVYFVALKMLFLNSKF